MKALNALIIGFALYGLTLVNFAIAGVLDGRLASVVWCVAVFASLAGFMCGVIAAEEGSDADA